MLYVTTRMNSATYTAQATLERATGPDGGLFCPLALPEYRGEALYALLRRDFWDCTAEVLNQFFPVRLKGEDFRELEIPATVFIRHKIAVAELWDRRSGGFGGLQSTLCAKLGSPLRSRGNWPYVAVNVALLFGVYGAVCRAGWVRIGEPVHLALACGEFTMPLAAWYARRMGLPLGTVIPVCNENGVTWELLHRGEARLDGAVTKSALPLLDVGLPCNLERLVAQSLGPQAAEDYIAARTRGRSFSLNPEQQATAREGFSVSVTGTARAGALIPRIYKTSDYLLSPCTALVYAGLMDFRSLEGEGTPTILLAEESPLKWGEDVLKALGLPTENLTARIGQLQAQAAARRKVD